MLEVEKYEFRTQFFCYFVNLSGCSLKEGVYARKAGVENDWHHVEISKTSTGNYKWKNRANVEWELIPRVQDCNLIDVDPTAPYYSDGSTSYSFNENGIYGPHGTFYEFKGKFHDCCIVGI